MPTLIDLPEKIAAGLTESTKEVFADVSQLDCIKDLVLCGGTGQSIQMNHRLSEDLDFELIGHLQIFINEGKVKLSFFRPENPVKSMSVGVQFNNLKAPVLQDLMGMKVFALCVRTVFRDYYDIYCLLERGCKLEEAISYASYLSRHKIRSKVMYSRLLSPQLFQREKDIDRMFPKYDVSAEEIRDRIKVAIETENLKSKAKI